MARKVILAMAIAMTVLVALAAPGWAHHKAGHSGGQGRPANPGHAGDDGGGYTEDNDTNDNDTPNNVEDGGDNAHPSGKDKSVEAGNSGNQGDSSSDPDDDGRGPDRSNGGADKPNGPGGVDLSDQDGNNGCGNDDDFEDDNEGWCGKPKDGPSPKEKGKPDEDVDEDTKDDDSDEVVDGGVDVPFDNERGPRVLGGTLDRDDVIDVEAVVDEEPLAREATGPDDTGALPFTGAGILGFLVIGLGLVATGFLLKTRTPRYLLLKRNRTPH